MAEITLLGTSHIAEESKKQIKKAISEGEFTIIGVELDKDRLQGLLSKRKSSYSPALIKQIGLSGYLFAVIAAFFSKRMGKLVGVMPGEDMLTAVKEGKKRNLKIALIDQPILITLRKYSKNVGFKTYMRVIKDFFKSIFMKKKMTQEMGLQGLDLRKVPTSKMVDSMIKYMEKYYPEVYSILIEDRNKYMINQLLVLAAQFPEDKILAVVGAGHVPGMKKLIEEKMKSQKSKLSKQK